MKHQFLMSFIFGILCISLLPISFAQSQESEIIKSETKAILNYPTSYEKTEIESNSYLSVQTSDHIYRPGEQVYVEGYVSPDVFVGLGESLGHVSVTFVDANGVKKGQEESTVDGDGDFYTSFVIPANAKAGQYTVTSKLEIDTELVTLLDLDVNANLESSTRFVVADVVEHKINVDDSEFFVSISSNSQVNNVEFNKDAKKLSFVVEGETGTEGTAEVDIPTSMLRGEMNVMIDGQPIAAKDVIVKSNTDVNTILEINYHHSTHAIEIVGTDALPEFPVAILIMSIAAIAMLLVSKIQITKVHQKQS